MKHRVVLASLAALASLATASAADLYKWTDEKGQVHYTSSPPEAARKPQQIDPANPSNATALPTQAAANGAANAPGVLFILDASGSMKAKIDNREKIVIAKEVMSNLLRDLPATIRVGLEVYGHHTKGDCNDIEVMAPVGQVDKTALIQRVQTIDPKGMTPITQALQVAAEQLKTAEQETTVVLVSDGEETCKGDPCAAVGSLVQQGVKLKVHVVGFDVAKKEQQQLICIAKAGNGKYFTANNAEQLKDALTEVKQEVVKKIETPPKEPEVTISQKVIKVQRPEIGTIEIKNNMTGFVKILDQQTGEEKASFCNGCGSNTQVPPGTYKLKFDNFTIDGIELTGGEKKVVDANTVSGIIEIKNNMTDSVEILDQQTGEKKASFCNGCGSNTQVPPGTYKLKFDNFTIDGIELIGGEKKVVDANTVSGIIEIKNNMTDSVEILDQQTGEKKASFCNGCGSNTQVPPGTYKLKFHNFTIDGIELTGGEKKVVDANTVSGIIEIKNFTDRGSLVQILDQQTSEEKADFCYGCGSNTQVAPGTYKLKYPNFTVENIVVEAGQNVVIE